MKKIIRTLSAPVAVAAMAAALTLLSTGSAKAQIFVGPGNDAGAAANYFGGTGPTIGAVNTANYGVVEGATADYTSTSTTTLGTSAGALSGLNWLSYPAGFATAGSGGTAGVATFNVSAGGVNFSGAFSNDGGLESVWIGNGGGTAAAIGITGGTVTDLNGTLIGRDGGSGTLSVSGGTFTTGALNATTGLIIGGEAAEGGIGTGLVTIGNGGLVYVSAAATNELSFSGSFAAAPNATSDFIDFTAASTGTLALNLTDLTTGTAATAYYDALITNGYVEIGGSIDTTLTDYSINTTSLSDSTLSLAPVPEPSTWALMLGGLGVLMLIQRRRSLNA